MSRDQQDGNVTIPASLHKYLYANGDPVDGRDPSGRFDLGEYVTKIRTSVRTAIEGTRIGESVLCYLQFASDVVNYIYIGYYFGTPVNLNIAKAYDDLRVCLALSSMY